MVKSDVEILTHKKISLSSEKQNCLLEYYDKFNTWLNYITYLDLTDHSESPDIYFLKVWERMENLYHNYLSAETKVDIFFIKDKELLLAKYALIGPTMKLLTHLKQYLTKAKTEANVFRLILDSPNSTYGNAEKEKKYRSLVTNKY